MIAPQDTVAAVSAPFVQDSTLIALRAQVDILLGMQETQTSIVLWSLATVAGLTISLLAFGWYTNFRIAGRERDALRDELEGLLKIRLKESADRSKGEVQTIRNSVDAKVASAVRNGLAEIRRGLLVVQYELRTQAVQRARDANHHFFLDAVELLDICIQGGWNWRIDEGLETVEEALRDKTRTPDPGIAAELEGLFGKLDPKYQATINRIRGLLESA